MHVLCMCCQWSYACDHHRLNFCVLYFGPTEFCDQYHALYCHGCATIVRNGQDDSAAAVLNVPILVSSNNAIVSAVRGGIALYHWVALPVARVEHGNECAPAVATLLETDDVTCQIASRFGCGPHDDAGIARGFGALRCEVVLGRSSFPIAMW